MHGPPPSLAGIPTRRLSAKERALWMLQRLYPDRGIANEAMAFAVPGRLDVAVLTGELQGTVRRHPALRTVFPEVGREPSAVVLPPDTAAIGVQLFESAAEPVDPLLADFASAPFDLCVDLPIRAGVWRLPDRDVCCIALHHLVFDGRSGGVLFSEIVSGYNLATSAVEVRRPRDPGVVAEPPQPEPSDPDLAFWRAHLIGVRPDAQRMALLRLGRGASTFAGVARRVGLAGEAVARVRALARRFRATENIVLLAAFYLLLARHGAGPDLVVGVPVYGRDTGERESVGYHMNSLPIRVTVDLSGTFRDLVLATRRAFLSGLEHWEVSYEMLVSDVAGAGSTWRAPLFRYVFNFLPSPVPVKTTLGGMPVDLLFVPPRYTRQDLMLTVESGRDNGYLSALYRSEMFDGADVAALMTRYDSLLRALDDSDRPLRDVPLWSPADRAVVEAADRVAVPAPAPLVPDTVAAVAAGSPAAVAVTGDAGGRTYGELVGEAGRTAGRLRAAGVRRGDVVALYADRGPALAAAVLGIWATGAAYLPLHPDSPADLLAFQLGDAGCAVALTDRPLPPGTATAAAVLPLSCPDGTPEGKFAQRVDAGDVAYVIYTSGSTGRPKGVEVTHGNLANLIAHFRSALPATADDAVLWLSNLAFDISALELLLPLCVGGRVVVAPDAARTDAGLLLDLVRRYDVDVVQATPTTWAHVVAAGARLDAAGTLDGRTVLCGGEPLPPPLAAGLLATGCRLLNVYGPTETTIWSTTAVLTADRLDPVPIGVPLRNTTAFVADPAGTELPPGLIGELCLAGEGVARGYLNRPELTAERFPTSDRHGRYYRTGDRASWGHDGNLYLHGRSDRQVKIRANRVELGEVEAVLADHPEVTAAAVLLRDDLGGEPSLVAYVQTGDGHTTAGDTADLVEALWRHARSRLPSYALPAHLELARLPLNSSGKVNYRELADRPVRRGPPAGNGARVDGLAGDILRIWREVLADPTLGPDDNFFLAGGQSLIAVRMLAQVSRLTDRQLSLEGLLDHPTVSRFAQYVFAAEPARHG